MGLSASQRHSFLPLNLNLYSTSCPMSASVATTTTTMTKSKSPRGGGGGSQGSRGHRGGGPGRRKSQNDPAPTESTGVADTLATPTVTEPTTVAENADATSPDDDTGICFICAEPIKYYSVSECNHRTCHVCALRLRALWKRQDCTFCKVRLTFMRKEPEFMDDFSFLIGNPNLLDLHHIFYRNIHIVQAE